MTTTEILIILVLAALTIVLAQRTLHWRKKTRNATAQNEEALDEVNWDDTENDDYEIVETTKGSLHQHRDSVTNSSITNHSATNAGATNTLSSLGFGGVDDMLSTVSPRVAQQTQKQPATYLPRDEDLVVVYVKARPGSNFVGYGLQQALQTAGLHFGEMSIFHRYEHENGQGHILFSVASAVEPGVFDLQRIGGFQTPGLSIFMTLSHCADPKKALIILLDTAQQLADDLGGELHDNHHQPFTENTVAEYRSRVRDVAAV